MTELVVYIAAYIEFRHCAELVCRPDVRSHGCETVKAFAEVPLLVSGLKIAGGNIVDYCIAENVLCCVGSLDIFCVLTENDTELDLVIEAVADIEVTVDGVARCNGFVQALCKIHGIAALDIEDRVRSSGLLGVVAVVEAEADDILFGLGDRRIEFHRVE